MFIIAVNPGMNAIAFTREVRALARLEGCAACTKLNNILRGAPKRGAHLQR